MKEDYVYGHCVFMLRKGSPYMGIINSIVGKVRDTGLVLYWEDLTVRRYMSTRRQLSVISSRKEVDPGPTQLLLRHVTVSKLPCVLATGPLSQRLRSRRQLIRGGAPAWLSGKLTTANRESKMLRNIREKIGPLASQEVGNISSSRVATGLSRIPFH
jgi:hypothetical protein